MKKVIIMVLYIFAMISLCACGNMTTQNTAQTQKVDIYKYTSDSTLPLLDENGFFLEIQDDDGTCEKLGLGSRGTQYNSASGVERMARAEEWGYSLTHLDGVTDGMGREIKSTFIPAPVDRKDAVNKIYEYLDAQYKSKSQSGVYYSMNGHYPWHHYAGENGFDVLGSEIGEGINNYQYHIAMNRGAAKQYSTPWFIDFSMWNNGTILDYNGYWKDNGSPTGGHTLSLMERAMIMSYASGTSSFVAEGGAHIAIYDDGTVTPYGEVCKKFNDFTKTYNQLGNAYVPFAVVLDFYHGTYMGQQEEKNAFSTFPYNDADFMTDSLLNMLYPDGIVLKGDESGAMVNNGGDLYDFFLQNADEEVLAQYPAIILSGDITFSDSEVEKFLNYAKNGGVLVLNCAYLDYFTEFTFNGETNEIPYGNGSVIVYGKTSSSKNVYSIKGLDKIIKDLTLRFVPFTVSDDIEYIVNVNKNEITLTLINNDGVLKKENGKEKIKSKTTDVNVLWNGTQSIKSVKEIYNGKEITQNGDSVSVELGSGDIAVLRYVIE